MSESIEAIALRKVHKEIDSIVTQIRANGNKSTGSDIARLRAILPHGYANSFPKKDKQNG